ncbi:MAG: right-handed parallel beta-helix repeat-containing protein, partial [Candidatus Hodarchaeales archaeon]
MKNQKIMISLLSVMLVTQIVAVRLTVQDNNINNSKLNLDLSTVSDTKLDYRLNNSNHFTGDDDNSTIFQPFFNQNHNFKPEITDSYLEIDGDENFIEKAIENGWNGNGTHDNPIILDNITFATSQPIGSLIYLSNTRLHFIIQNHALQGSEYKAPGWLYIYNVSNGNMVNNTISEFGHGLSLNNVTNINIFQNNFSNNKRGIYVEYGLDVKISNNNIQDSILEGLHINKCKNILIEQNRLKNSTNNA